MKTYFPTMSTREIRDAAERGAVALLPIGTVEGNGPLPLGYDYLVPMELAKAAAQENGDVWLPPLTYGVSDSILAFPGTIAISPDLLQRQIEAVVGGLIDSGFSHVCLVTYHIPNQYPASVAMRNIRKETGVIVASVNPGSLQADLRGDLFAGDEAAFGHGGEPGASLLAFLYPGSVRTDLAAPRPKGDYQDLELLSPMEAKFGASRVGLPVELEAVAPSSGWGDAGRGSAERGEELFRRMAAYLAEFTRHFRTMDTRIAPPTVAF